MGLHGLTNVIFADYDPPDTGFSADAMDTSTNVTSTASNPLRSWSTLSCGSGCYIRYAEILAALNSNNNNDKSNNNNNTSYEWIWVVLSCEKALVVAAAAAPVP